MIARRSISIVIAVAMFLVAGAIAVAGPGESTFVSKINAERQTNGLEPLTVLSGLTTYGRSHSEEMANAGQIFHSTSDELRALANSVAPGWQRLGENVGVGGSVDALHTAFMNSSGHRANILGDYTHVGVGTFDQDGVLFVTEIFVKLPSSTTTSPTTTATTAPPPTTTVAPTTTAAQTTTTKATTTTTQPATTTEATTTTTEAATTTTTETTSVPSTTDAPSTTESPSTTEGPSTTEAPSTTATTLGPETTTTAPSPTTTVAGSGSIPTSGPNAPGAADTVRLVAGIVLGATVVLFLLALRRRGGIAIER